MLHSRRLLYINEIARCGSIRKAAARLNVASSAINRQILALEEEMGAPLFERLPRGLRLTAAGELCIEHIREVLKNYERLEGRIRSLKMQQAGKIRMVATSVLVAALRQVQRRPSPMSCSTLRTAIGLASGRGVRTRTISSAPTTVTTAWPRNGAARSTANRAAPIGGPAIWLSDT